MEDPFDKVNLLINKLVGRTYHNPLGHLAFHAAAKRAGINSKSRVLDVGTGRGFGAVYIAETFGCRVTGIDVSSAMLAEARKLAGSLASGPGRNRVRFYNASLAEFKSKQPFNLICCFDVMGFVPKRRRAVRDLARLLQHNGFLAWSDYYCTRKTRAAARLITGWNLRSIGNYDSIRAEMEAANLKIIQYKDTTPLYRRHWEKVRRRLTQRQNMICKKVGKKPFRRYRAAVDAILDATKEGSFGHVSGIAQAPHRKSPFHRAARI